MNQIQVIIPSSEGNACPSRDAFRQLASERLMQKAKGTGAVEEGATSWPTRTEFVVRPALSGGYEVTATFES